MSTYKYTYTYRHKTMTPQEENIRLQQQVNEELRAYSEAQRAATKETEKSAEIEADNSLKSKELICCKLKSKFNTLNFRYPQLFQHLVHLLSGVILQIVDDYIYHTLVALLDLADHSSVSQTVAELYFLLMHRL